MMKRVEKLFAAGLIFIFAGIIIHTPLTLWLGTVWPEYALVIKSWKEIIMFLLIPVAAWLVTRHRLWREFLNDWLFRFIVAFAGLHFLVAAIWRHGFEQTLAGIGIDLRYILYFALVYTLIRIAPHYRVILCKVAAVGAVLITGFAALQFFLPADILRHIGYSDQTIKPYQLVDDNPAYVRVNSTLRGPNPLGAYAAAALAIIAAYVVSKKRDNKKAHGFAAIAGVLASAGLWLSYSRSAIVAAFIGVGVAGVAGLRKVTLIMWKAIALIVIVVLAVAILARDSSFVKNVILHDNPTTGAVVTSNDDHVTSLQTGAARLVAQPFGAGIGSTGSASLLGDEGIIIENQYLFIAHETGWPGLILYVTIFGVILWRLFRHRKDWLALGVFASGVCLGLIGLLLPVWTDDAVSIIWWGLAAIALGGIHGKAKKSK